MAYNRCLLLPMLCPRRWQSWSVLSRCRSSCWWVSGLDVSLGSVIWKTGCCHCSMPPPHPTPYPHRWWIQRNSRTTTVWHQWHHRSSQNQVEYNDKLPLGLQLRIFPQGLLLKPFPKNSNCKATVIIARWPPLPLQNQRPLTDVVLSSIWVSNHTPHHFPCEKWWGCLFSQRRLDPEAGSTGLQVTSRNSIRPEARCLPLSESEESEMLT